MGNLRLRPIRLGSGSGLAGAGPGAGVEPGVADEAALKSIPPGDRDDRDLCFVESPASLWRYDAQSAAVVGADILLPDDYIGVIPLPNGRWHRTPLTADILAALVAAPTPLTGANPAISAAEKTALDTAVAARVVGPAASVDNALMVYDGVLGKTAKCGLAAVAPTVDPVTGSIGVPAGATVDGVDVSAHAAATDNVHGQTATAAEINRACDLSANRAIEYVLVSGEITVINGLVAAFALPATALVKKTWLKVTLVKAGQTVDVGTVGDDNGLLAAASVNLLECVDGPVGALGLDYFSTGGEVVNVKGAAASADAKVYVYCAIVDMV